VGTQIANLPSIRLYEKLGFSLVKSAYVMHRHVPQPENR
jgi:RimJ/RimL family protein N-acetyltransferase